MLDKIGIMNVVRNQERRLYRDVCRLLSDFDYGYRVVSFYAGYDKLVYLVIRAPTAGPVTEDTPVLNQRLWDDHRCPSARVVSDFMTIYEVVRWVGELPDPEDEERKTRRRTKRTSSLYR